jgi:multiple sugar transport system ATP-binding protein
MNFLTGRLHAVDGGIVFETPSGVQLQVDANGARDGVTLGIRPEHLTVVTADQGIAAEIISIEPTGSETYIVASIGGDRVAALVRQRIAGAPGDRIGLLPQAGTTHLFDAATGGRLN